MEEKDVEKEINFKGQVLKNKAKTELEKWYPLNTQFRITKPRKAEGFQIEIEFPSDVRTGINPAKIKLQGEKGHNWACWYGQESDYEMKNLSNELNKYRIKNSRLQSMIEVFWNINNFRDKHLLMKKTRLETIRQLVDYLEFKKGVIEDEYGDEDYLNVIDGFKKHVEEKLKELETDFIRESDRWKIWCLEDYEKLVVDLEF